MVQPVVECAARSRLAQQHVLASPPPSATGYEFGAAFDRASIIAGAAGPMFKKILIATDGSEFSLKAARLAVRLASSLGAELVAITEETLSEAYLCPPNPVIEIEQAFERESYQFLSEIAEIAKASNVPCRTKRVRHSSPFEAILATAAAESCDLIVMGSHGRSGLGALLLGSVTQKVLAHATIPVLVSR
jgi:nucleotide-binding universal stress UspA family protein